MSIRPRERKAGRVRCSVDEGFKARIIKRSLTSNLPFERLLIKFFTYPRRLRDESCIKVALVEKQREFSLNRERLVSSSLTSAWLPTYRESAENVTVAVSATLDSYPLKIQSGLARQEIKVAPVSLEFLCSRVEIAMFRSKEKGRSELGAARGED